MHVNRIARTAHVSTQCNHNIPKVLHRWNPMRASYATVMHIAHFATAHPGSCVCKSGFTRHRSFRGATSHQAERHSNQTYATKQPNNAQDRPRAQRSHNRYPRLKDMTVNHIKVSSQIGTRMPHDARVGTSHQEDCRGQMTRRTKHCTKTGGQLNGRRSLNFTPGRLANGIPGSEQLHIRQTGKMNDRQSQSSHRDNSQQQGAAPSPPYVQPDSRSAQPIRD
jgi:hypothetical protein